jgi:predicted kinase
MKGAYYSPFFNQIIMVVKKNNLVFIILVGIPCSGKSTWVQKNVPILMDKYGSPVIVISRDDIRLALFGKNYKQNSEDEKKVTTQFYKQLSHASNLEDAVVILDNTHVKHAYIDAYFATFKSLIESGKAEIFVKFFDIPLWKAKWRNFWRDMQTGKHIPKDVLEKMYHNYSWLDKKKYKENLLP